MDPAGHGAPDPEQAHSSAEFVAQMQALKEWSGLTYRELTSRAEAVGDVLPRSTVANMLSRSTVPREELVAAFVRACGCGPGVSDSWLRVRKELTRRERQSVELPDFGVGDGVGDGVGEGVGVSVGDVEPGPGTHEPEPPRRTWRRTRALWPAAVVALGAAAVAVTLAFLVPEDDKGDDKRDDKRGERHAAVVAPAPGPGPVQIRAVRTGLCLAERPEQESGQVYEAPCSDTAIPRYSLQQLGAGTWRILSDHPEFGPGCMGARDSTPAGDASLEDKLCGRRGPAETFRFEPVGDPVRGYRMRLEHLQLCLGVPPTGPDRLWAEVLQAACAVDDEGQLFSFDPDRTAGAG